MSHHCTTLFKKLVQGPFILFDGSIIYQRMSKRQAISLWSGHIDFKKFPNIPSWPTIKSTWKMRRIGDGKGGGGWDREKFEKLKPFYSAHSFSLLNSSSTIELKRVQPTKHLSLVKFELLLKICGEAFFSLKIRDKIYSWRFCENTDRQKRRSTFLRCC